VVSCRRTVNLFFARSRPAFFEKSRPLTPPFPAPVAAPAFPPKSPPRAAPIPAPKASRGRLLLLAARGLDGDAVRAQDNGGIVDSEFQQCHCQRGSPLHAATLKEFFHYSDQQTSRGNYNLSSAVNSLSSSASKRAPGLGWMVDNRRSKGTPGLLWCRNYDFFLSLRAGCSGLSLLSPNHGGHSSRQGNTSKACNHQAPAVHSDILPAELQLS